METPCANMDERQPVSCSAGRKFPEDCHRACAAYSAGFTEQERVRLALWNGIRRYWAFGGKAA